MRLVIQRVSSAAVRIKGEVHSQIDRGLLILVGIESEDNKSDADYLLSKCINLRIFEDKAGKMNLSLSDISGEMLIVSQFTLHASTKKGNRPSFMNAAKPEKAEPLYHYFVEQSGSVIRKDVKSGKFGAYMEIKSVNDGPVTILMDSKNRE